MTEKYINVMSNEKFKSKALDFGAMADALVSGEKLTLPAKDSVERNKIRVSLTYYLRDRGVKLKTRGVQEELYLWVETAQ